MLHDRPLTSRAATLVSPGISLHGWRAYQAVEHAGCAVSRQKVQRWRGRRSRRPLARCHVAPQRGTDLHRFDRSTHPPGSCGTRQAVPGKAKPSPGAMAQQPRLIFRLGVRWDRALIRRNRVQQVPPSTRDISCRVRVHFQRPAQALRSRANSMHTFVRTQGRAQGKGCQGLCETATSDLIGCSSHNCDGTAG